MTELVHKYITGNAAVKISQSIENALREGKIAPGQQLPTVRALAKQLGVAPATVAAAYRALQTRGVVMSQGRRGTTISHRPAAPIRRSGALACGGRNLRDGNPDPELLPRMGPALRKIDTSHHMYGQQPHDPALVQLVTRDLKKCRVSVGDVCVTSGAMDAMERVLTDQLKPGDRVIVEDPGFGNTFELVLSRGLVLIPVPLDQEGFLPDEFAKACSRGAEALVMTPRAQNPTGAAMSESRARELRKILRKHRDLLIIEDDHMQSIVDIPLFCLHEERTRRWAHIRSFSKSLNPDLRLAVMTGDAETMARAQDRFVSGERWVSHILQRVAYVLLSDKSVRQRLKAAARTYTQRREGLLRALQREGVEIESRSGFHVWIPVCEETATVQSLERAGWSVSAGERFRLNSPPAIRICAATLKPQEAIEFAAVYSKVQGAGPTTCTV